MRQKKVWRYYCDYCKKANCSKSSIEKHEQHCTMRPDRHCGMCDYIENMQKNIETLKDAFIEDVNCHFEKHRNDYIFSDAVDIPKLRKTSGNCPACILATIRQAYSEIEGLGVYVDFDYHNESQATLEAQNDRL